MSLTNYIPYSSVLEFDEDLGVISIKTQSFQKARIGFCHISAPEHLFFNFLSLPPILTNKWWWVGTRIFKFRCSGADILQKPNIAIWNYCVFIVTPCSNWIISILVMKRVDNEEKLFNWDSNFFSLSVSPFTVNS